MRDSQLYKDKLESPDEKLAGIEARERFYASHDHSIAEIASEVTAKYRENLRNMVACAIPRLGLLRDDTRTVTIKRIDAIRDTFNAFENPTWMDCQEAVKRINSLINP